MPDSVLSLPRYVFVGPPLGKRLTLRSALPDSHPKSWPSKYREVTGEEIPEGWRERLRVPSHHLTMNESQ